MDKQRAYLLIGLPGSGKSTWSANKMDDYNPRGIGVVSRDAIRYMINGNYKYDKKQQELITNIAAVSAREILKSGRDLIIDQANINSEVRKEVIDFLGTIIPREKLEIWFVYFNIDDTKSLVERRMLGDCRGEYGSYHENVINKMKENFEPPRSTEDNDVVLYINEFGCIEDRCRVIRDNAKKNDIPDDIPLEELWCLNNTLAEYILPRLKAFRDKHCGAPGYLQYKNGEKRCSKKYGPNNQKNICFREWGNILDKMVLAFELWLSSDDWDCEFNSKEYSKRWFQIEEGMNLFIKHFNGLWW